MISSTASYPLNALRRCTSLASAAKRIHSSCVQILPEVAEALRGGRPVVALESTIVAHGMPYPQNLELAKDVSQILRSKGVIPATIAVKNGVFKAGLHHDEMEDLAKAGEEGRAIKCSTRDLPLAASSYYRQMHHKNLMNSAVSRETRWGATTVAATMRLAHAAGIVTFVTGGTGGVHRGGELSLDISTDMIELSRTPVIVVSAGVKSILDIKRTLEVLETFGVPTGAWQSDDFPAFFSPVSGVKAPATFNDAMDVACAWAAGRDLGMTNGMLVAVPNYDPAGSNVEAAIQEALKDASSAGIEGRDVTPFILRTVAEKTGGDSLRSNISLVKKNAMVGAEIATAVSSFSSCSFNVSTRTIQSLELPRSGVTKSRVVCVGGSVMDIVAKPNIDGRLIIGSSNPGKIHHSDGGVGRNVAEVLGRLGSKPIFYTAVGNDEIGRGILRRLSQECGVIANEETTEVVDHIGTAQYYALNDHSSDLVGAIADMDVLSHIPIPSISDLEGVEFLVLDANLPVERAMEASRRGVQAGCKVCFEPTSVTKSKTLVLFDFLRFVTYAFPNEDELLAMANIFVSDEVISDGESGVEYKDLEVIKHAAGVLLSKMKSDGQIVITLGKRGVLLAMNSHSGEAPVYIHFPAEVVADASSSNGPGDTLCGAFIHSLLTGSDSAAAVRFGMEAAVLSLRHESSAISPLLSSLSLNKYMTPEK